MKSKNYDRLITIHDALISIRIDEDDLSGAERDALKSTHFELERLLREVDKEGSD